jgi:hypothetical protein
MLYLREQASGSARVWYNSPMRTKTTGRATRMPLSAKPQDKTQRQRFIEAAREAGASEDEAVFDENLKRLAARAKPKETKRTEDD